MAVAMALGGAGQPAAAPRAKRPRTTASGVECSRRWPSAGTDGWSGTNDFHNLGGGYIVISVAEDKGRPVLPPVGITQGDAEHLVNIHDEGELPREATVGATG